MNSPAQNVKNAHTYLLQKSRMSKKRERDKVGKELARLCSSARGMRLKFKPVKVAMVKNSQSQYILRRMS